MTVDRFAGGFARLAVLCVVLATPFQALGGGMEITRPRLDVVGMSGLPLAFEPNRGQADPAVLYVGRGSGTSLAFSSDSVFFSLSRKPSGEGARVTNARVSLRLLGASPGATITGDALLPGKSNYFIGDDPALWRTDVSTYSKIRYEKVYPGVDLVFYGNQKRLEYDVVVEPGADPGVFRFEVKGAAKTRIEAGGDLVLDLNGVELRQPKPRVYQTVGGQERPVAGKYVRRGRNTYGFKVGPYDRTAPLVIDPVIQFSTFLGGHDDPSWSLGEVAYAIALDGTRDAYVTGYTTALDFPVVNQIPGAVAQNPFYNGSKVFVAKIHRSGNSLEYCTYLGGYGSDAGYGIAVDAAGNAYVAGNASNGFPTVAPLSVGSGTAFLAKLNPAGSAILFSTRFGGNGATSASAIALDGERHAYITGTTASTDFPVPGGYQSSRNGEDDAFVIKIDPVNSLVLYGTYLGGSGREWARSIAVDSARRAVVTGETYSSDFPRVNPLQGTFGGPVVDAFVTKLTDNGGGLIYSTYLGGSNDPSVVGAECGFGVAVDSDDNAYVTGTTQASNFPVKDPIQGTFGGGVSDAFVTKIDPNGSLVWSTFLGGSGLEYGYAIAVDASKEAYVAGKTMSSDFPLKFPVQGAFGGTLPNWGDAFVSKINAAGNDFIYSTFLGGVSEDSALGIAVDFFGAAYVAGTTASANFPLGFPIQGQLVGTWDAFVAKIADVTVLAQADVALTMASVPNPAVANYVIIYTLTVTNHGPDPAFGATMRMPLPVTTAFAWATPSQGACSATAIVTCTFGDLAKDASAFATIAVTPLQTGTISASAAASSDVSDPDTTNNAASAATQVNPDADIWPSPLSAGLGAPAVAASSDPVVFTLTNITNILMGSGSPRDLLSSAALVGVTRNIGQIVFTGPDAGEFLLTADGCSNLPLAPGAACNVSVVLHPLSQGVKSAFLTVPSDDPKSPLLVPLTGTGYTPGPPATFLRRTGQTSCWNDDGTVIPCSDPFAIGEDGAIGAGLDWPVPRFIDNGDGTMTDTLTALMWLKHANCAQQVGLDPDGFLFWQPALNFVAGINNGTYDISSCADYTANYTDWHVPNVHELQSLLHSEISTASWLQLQGFAIELGSYNYWTSTTEPGIPADAYWISLHGSVQYRSKNDPYVRVRVWPVRLSTLVPRAAISRTGQKSCYDDAGVIPCAGTGQDGALQAGVAWPSPRFIDHGNGTVTDRLTNLMWTRNANSPGPAPCGAGGTSGWSAALGYAACLNSHNYLNHADWRLPNREELFSLLNFGSSDPALPAGHPFTNVQLSSYWTSTTVPGTWPHPAVDVNLATGRVFEASTPSAYAQFRYVWAVRGGQTTTPTYADLSLTGSASAGSVLVGAGLTYTLTVTNGGPGAATGAFVTDTLPNLVTPGTVTSSVGACQTTGRVVTCNLGDLASAAAATITISTTATGAGTLTNTAFASSNSIDTDPGDNNCTVLTLATTPLSAPAITSANSKSFTAGSFGTFTVTTTGSPTPMLGATGALPAGVTFFDNGDTTGTLSGTPASGTAGVYPLTFTASNGVGSGANQPFTLTVLEGVPTGSFFTLPPCRVLDTRNPIGPLAGPSLSGGSSRSFVLVNTCNIPATATAVSVNIAETQAQGSGHLRIYPAGSPLPNVAAINFRVGQTRSNNAILPLGPSGDISVYAGIGAGFHVDFILDVNGYFQ